MSTRSSTSVVEPQERPVAPAQALPKDVVSINRARPSSDGAGGRFETRNSSGSGRRIGDLDGVLPPPTTVSEIVEKWNHPRSNISRVFAAFFSLLVMGANDAAYGAIIPYLGKYYNLEYTFVSLIFLSPFVGYTLSAVLNNTLHHKIGQRGIGIVCGSFHIIAFLVICLHPPYPVLVVVYMFAGFGSGIGDAAWNAWIGAMANANEVLGIMHALYGVGAVLSPLVATSMITKYHLEWYKFYYVLLGLGVAELTFLTAAFWPATGKVYRELHPRTTDTKNSRMHEALLQMPAARVTWLCAVFLLCYVGAEVALGGWIVTFMMQVRNGESFASGMTATGFWLGLAVGRVILGFVTPRLGERLALMIYLPTVMALELFFWLIPQFYVSAIAVSLQGFFLGPLFPAVVVAATKLLPKHLHVSAIGFAAAFGGGGAAVLPFAVGAIAQSKGVQVLQPIILSLVAVLFGLWLCLPRFNKKRE